MHVLLAMSDSHSPFSHDCSLTQLQIHHPRLNLDATKGHLALYSMAGESNQASPALTERLFQINNIHNIVLWIHES